MALNGHELVHYLAVDDVEGTAQPDPNASLGGNRSSTAIHEIQSTLTSAQTDARKMVDTARIGDGIDAHVGKWILFMTGTAAVHASEILAFDDATGEFLLVSGTPSLAASADTYRIYDVNAFWDDLDAGESASGVTQYRLLYLHNETGFSVTSPETKLALLDGAGIEFALAQWDGTGDKQGITVIPDEETEPDLDELEASSNTVPRFEQPVGLNSQLQVPRLQPASYSNSAAVPIWLRRVGGQGRLTKPRVVLQVIHKFASTGGDPDPLVTSGLIIFGLTGLTPQASLTRDRAIRVGGGARYVVALTAQESGLPIVGEQVAFQQTAGPGSLDLSSDPDDFRTDEDGTVFASHVASTNEGDEGQTVTVEAQF